MKWTNKGHEFDEAAKIICNPSNEYYLWGAGEGCKKFIKSYGNKIKIAGIYDSDEKRVGEEFYGYKILCKENLQDKKVIITTSDYYQDLIDFLEEKGLKRNRNYFLKDDFVMIRELYGEGKLTTVWLNLDITDKCNLSCRDCIMFAPYFKKAEHQSFENLKSDIDKTFEQVHFTWAYHIMGGEPLLNPRIEDIIDYIGVNYRDRMDDFLITTNGIAKPKDSFFQVCKKYDVHFRISDYSISTGFNKKQNIGFWREKTEEYNLICEIFGDGIWRDYGNPKDNITGGNYNQLEQLYNICDCAHPTVRDGKLYSCCRNAAAVWSGMIESVETDYFDLKGENIDKKHILEYMLKFCDKGFISCCQYCYGKDNTMIVSEIPAAVQLD